MTAPEFKPPDYYTPPRSTSPVLIAVIAIVALVVIGGGLAWALGLGPFAPSQASVAGSPTPSPPGSATAPHPTGQQPASPEPSETPLPTSGPGTPGSAAEALLGHVPGALRASCMAETLAPPAQAMLTCAADGGVTVSYTSYSDQPSMAVAYEATVLAAGIEDNSGRCYNKKDDGTFAATPDRWPSENGYTINDESVGRYLCYQPDAPSIAWTDDRLYILGVAGSASSDVDRLVAFWVNEAGPLR